MKRPLLALIPLLVVAACLGSDFADSIQGSWILESGTLNGEPIDLHDSHPVILILEGGAITGTAACNSYSGQYRISAPDFVITDGVAVTEMACFPDEVMTTERQYLDALLDAQTVALDDGQLTLAGPMSQLVFAATALRPG